ncbi:hypothetical protein [Aliivibrio wodanis]|uniref:hypothetical protein n=1 Tax=Aliivibrio wodanis TaxID=80852 RepID=UPI00406C4D81
MIYFKYNKETFVVDLNPTKATHHAVGQFTVPRNAITDESIIKSPKEGFEVIAIDIDVSGTPRATEYIRALIDKTVYDKSDCTNSKLMDKLGEPDFDWTLDKPKTRFDEWFDGLGWVTNTQNKYQSEVFDVDSNRRYLYSTIVDPLRAEAYDEALQGNIDKSDELDKQRIEARKKIKDENPFPEYPTDL